MHEQQFLEESELTNGDIGRPGSLKTFNSRDSDSNVSSLNHADVVGTVSDGEKKSFEVLLDEFDNESLLKRGDSACGRGGYQPAAATREAARWTYSRPQPCT